MEHSRKRKSYSGPIITSVRSLAKTIETKEGEFTGENHSLLEEKSPQHVISFNLKQSKSREIEKQIKLPLQDGPSFSKNLAGSSRRGSVEGINEFNGTEGVDNDISIQGESSEITQSLPSSRIWTVDKLIPLGSEYSLSQVRVMSSSTLTQNTRQGLLYRQAPYFVSLEKEGVAWIPTFSIHSPLLRKNENVRRILSDVQIRHPVAMDIPGERHQKSKVVVLYLSVAILLRRCGNLFQCNLSKINDIKMNYPS